MIHALALKCPLWVTLRDMADKQQFHENFVRTEKVKGSTNRTFGLVFAAVFALVALWPLLFGNAFRLWAAAVAAAFLVVTLVAPQALSPLNRAWTWLGLAMHAVVNPLVMGLMFFAMITPLGLLMRALGKDLLRLKRDKQAASYWIERHPPGPAPETMRNQF